MTFLQKTNMEFEEFPLGKGETSRIYKKAIHFWCSDFQFSGVFLNNIRTSVEAVSSQRNSVQMGVFIAFRRL